MINDLNMWNKIGRIVTRLSERLNISNVEAFRLFYTSTVCKDLHDPDKDLYLFGDEYIVDELLIALNKE